MGAEIYIATYAGHIYRSYMHVCYITVILVNPVGISAKNSYEVLYTCTAAFQLVHICPFDQPRLAVSFPVHVLKVLCMYFYCSLSHYTGDSIGHYCIICLFNWGWLTDKSVNGEF